MPEIGGQTPRHVQVIIRALADRTGALLVTFVASKSVLPESQLLSLGSSLQRLPNRRCLAEANLVIAIGTEIAEPDLFVTVDSEASCAVDPVLLRLELSISGRFARIDLDFDVLARAPIADITILSDARLAAEALLAALPALHLIDRTTEAATLRAAGTHA